MAKMHRQSKRQKKKKKKASSGGLQVQTDVSDVVDLEAGIVGTVDTVGSVSGSTKIE